MRKARKTFYAMPIKALSPLTLSWGLFFFVLLFIFLISPSISRAGWLTTFSLKSAPKAEEKDPNYGISGSVIKPTVEDLQKRVAELESALREAEAKLAARAVTTAAPAANPAPAGAKTQAAAAQASSLSEKQIAGKAKSAMVSIETATTTGSGTIIDAQGHILLDAHTVWTEDSRGIVIGAAEEVTAILSSGARKKAKLVGIDEAHDLAILQLSDKVAPSYLALSYDTNVAKGESAYVASLPVSNGGGSGGSGFVSGTVTQKSASAVEINTDSKPYDTGGALINASGELVGIPNKSTCKVLEEMTNCLKYRITANLNKTLVPKLIAGMRLYKQRAGETPSESAVRDALDTMRQSVTAGTIDFAISSASGENTFDYFNGRIGQDEEGKIAKLYILKLKQIAANYVQAADLLKSKSYDLNVFFIDQSANIAAMGSYQRAALAKLQADNAVKVKEYQAKLDYWTKKKNEYDSLILKAASVNHDYLMAEGAAEELETKYFKAEKKRILETFSGETVNIF